MSNAAKQIVFESEDSQGNEIFVKTSTLNDQQKAKGYYLSIADQGNVQGFYLGTRISTGKYPGQTEHMLQTLDGTKVLVIKQQGNLGARLKDKNVQVGDAVQISYKGKSAAKGGMYAGTLMHRFSVQTEADTEDND